MVNLVTTSEGTTSLSTPPKKSTPSNALNVTVEILPRTTTKAELTVGYIDGKVEKFVVEGSSPEAEEATTGASSTTPLGQALKAGKKRSFKSVRKENEVISYKDLVAKVDAWARSLKVKDQATS